MRRHDLRARARQAVGERFTSAVMCLACGWQGWIEYTRPHERWTCFHCGEREMIRDDEEASRPARHEIEEGEA